MSDEKQQNEQTIRMQNLEAEVKRLTREKASLETKNEDLTKKLRITEGDRDRAEALLNMAMEWRGVVVDKIAKFEDTLTQFSTKLEGLDVSAPRRKKR